MMVTTENNFDDRISGVALEVWQQARRLHYVTVTGNSMWPLICEGDLLLVAYGEQGISKGDVAVIYNDKRLLVHRITRIKGKEPERIYITKGDNHCRKDSPSHIDQIMGRVLTVQRGDRQLVLDEPPWLIVGRFIALVTPILSPLYCLGRSIIRTVGKNPSAQESRDELAQVETDLDND